MAVLTLGSASPRRRELLGLLALDFDVTPSRVDESSVDSRNVDPGAFVRALATMKAEEVGERIRDGLVLGADTVVVLDQEILGKPVDLADAERMLRALAGRLHRVVTGLSLIRFQDRVPVQRVEDHVETTVRMRAFSPETLQAYLDTGEPMDKAGAYAIQGRGALLVKGIVGDFFNVVGLPVGRLAEMLGEFGIRCL